MSFGTYANAEIYFSRETYNSLYKVDESIEECDADIHTMESLITAWAFGKPTDFIASGTNVETAEGLLARIKQVLEDYRETVIDRYKLELLKENWETRHGDFVDNPDYYKEEEEKE